MLQNQARNKHGRVGGGKRALELTKKIKSHHPHIKIVILTALDGCSSTARNTRRGWPCTNPLAGAEGVFGAFVRACGSIRF